jgi:hypothetical protein
MTVDEYWKLLGKARDNASDNSDIESVAQAMKAELLNLTPEEIVSAEQIYSTLAARAYTANLWGAAYLINGGCSDDGFDYFRGWLIGNGKDVYEKALADPDSLADIVKLEDDTYDGESLMSSAVDAYKELTGTYPEGNFDQWPDLEFSWDFDDEDEMRSRYPRLAQMFL